MEMLFPIGLALFGVGLVMTHIVLFVTRKSARKRQKMASSHRVFMWLALGLALAGVALAAAGFFLS